MMKTLLFALTLAAQSTSPQGPSTIELIGAWAEPDRPTLEVNPMRDGDHVAVRWEHTCTTCDFILRLDGIELTTARSAGTTTYVHDLGVVPTGVHTIEVETTNGEPCPPPTVQPAGCSRYFMFTVMRDGTVVSHAPASQRVGQGDH